MWIARKQNLGNEKADGVIILIEKQGSLKLGDWKKSIERKDGYLWRYC